MGRISKLFLAGLIGVTFANANDVMKTSMTKMDEGMNMIQKGFMHNNMDLIKDGLEAVSKGNSMFSDEKVIAQYLPKDKKHMVNVASNQAKRITLDVSLMELRLNEKGYVDAAHAYSDILNACSRCHAIVRDW